MSKYFKLYETFINWLHHKLSARQFLIFSSILVGITAGLAAVILKTAVHYIHAVIIHDYHIRFQYILYLLFPVIGILLSVMFVQKHLNGKMGRGTASILYSIAQRSSFLPKYQMYSQMITSALTVGLGGSAGLESPIVITGAAIGSNYSKTYHITYKDRTLLLACGVAAGIAAAFNSPIAGVLFALEVLLAEVSITRFIPLIIASATGGLLSKIILNEDILLTFKLRQPFDYHNVIFYVLLALLAGLFSVYYARIFPKVESWMKRLKTNVYGKVLAGGMVLALLIFFFPPLFGEGYDTIKVLSEANPAQLFEHSIWAYFLSSKWLVVVLIVLAMFLKTMAAALTIGSGGNGGNFAPTLFVGAYLGFSFATIINLLGISTLPVSNFTIVAMAGVLSGVFHAPLTGIFLIAEITGGYELMIPLMMVSAISFMVSKYFETYSMDTKKLARKGHLLTSDKDRTILSSLKTTKIIETDFQVILPDVTLRQLIEIVAQSKRNVFPVVENQNLVGIILLDDIREIMFKHEMYDTIFVKQLMQAPAATLSPNEDMKSVMKKFDETGAWNLPVVHEAKYIGFISKSSIFTQYRSRLIRATSE